MRQEIVSDEEAHEDPVVDGALEVVRERQVRHLQVLPQVLAQDRQPDEDELGFVAERRLVVADELRVADGLGRTGAVGHLVA